MYRQNLRLVKKKILNIKKNKRKRGKKNNIWPKNNLNNICKFDLEKKKKQQQCLNCIKMYNGRQK